MEAPLRQRAVGGESFELRELNERLECYLQRVGALEQENTRLQSELDSLRRLPPAGGAGGMEGELQCARVSLAKIWGQLDGLTLERDSLLDEVGQLQEGCARQGRRRDQLVRELARRRRELEEEERGRLGLVNRLQALERERKVLQGTHQEELGRLREERARWAPSLGTAPTPQALGSGDWELYREQFRALCEHSREAYRQEVARLERALAQGSERERSARERRKQARVELLALEQELASRKQQRTDLLAQVGHCQEKHTSGLQELQERIDQLEKDKASLMAKMQPILAEQQSLMQAKLDLSLEVIMY
ncbi:glial fibrillary acidic protein-like, partial [Chiloscyllium plagiosum]|uniref:glial fibrillary acidic protein-like n=1 Tax=Chiloscyllium plagiosum TaxID=36176 RepID=UPI001CB7EAEA